MIWTVVLIGLLLTVFGATTAAALITSSRSRLAEVVARRLRGGGMARGVVHAKTGTLDEVATLAGYLARQDGVLVLSLMYNGRRTGAARAAEWEVFRLLGAEGVDLDGALDTHIGGIEPPIAEHGAAETPVDPRQGHPVRHDLAKLAADRRGE